MLWVIVFVWIINLTCSNNIKLSLVPNTCWFPITVGLVLCGRANTASFCSKHLLSSVIDFFVSHHCSLSVLKCLSTRLSFVCRPRGTCVWASGACIVAPVYVLFGTFTWLYVFMPWSSSSVQERYLSGATSVFPNSHNLLQIDLY